MFDEATLVCRCAVLSVKVLPDSLSALKHFLAEKDPEIALAIHAVLIKSGDPDEVAQFAVFEEKSLNDDFVRSLSVGSSMRLGSIGSALNRTRSEKALPALARLADSSREAIRLGALDAIRLIKSKKSIPVLIKHLDDSNHLARYISAISLNEITGKNNMPFMGDFEKDESKYIGVWKTWWEAEGRAIYDVQAKPEAH
jgi:HEAT repeat protein